MPEPRLVEDIDELDLSRVVRTLWRARLVIAAFVAMFVGAVGAYAFTARQWYLSEVLLAPAELPSDGVSSALGGLGGLASLAGINLGAADTTAERLATLNSHGFIAAFIEDMSLLPVLLADDWDQEKQAWRVADSEKWPDVRDAVKFFKDHVLRVREDRRTGLVTLSIEWTDPALAAHWANLLVERANDRIRARALSEANATVAYLSEQMESANLVVLQQAIGRVLESQLQKAVLANGTKEFAFRIVDRAHPPKWHSRPRRAQLLILAVFAGGLTGALVVLVWSAMRKKDARVQ